MEKQQHHQQQQRMIKNDTTRKGKYMPLSETMEHTSVDSYDGQAIYIGSEVRYQIGNYLGGGIAGVVYEAYDRKEGRQTAIKILNPIGYKLTPFSVLKKCTVAVKGVAVSSKARFTREHLWWLVHPNTRQVIAAYQDASTGKLTELPLNKCVEIWGWKAHLTDDEDPTGCSAAEQQQLMLLVQVVKIGNSMVKIPSVPSKFISFLKNRQSIYREIAHMHKLTGNGRSGQVMHTGHRNVLKLYNVLELTQTSKSTIFLVLELATGGELFDRIKPDCGVEESTAQMYFRQLLSGVMYCHQLGIVHRDLKPENLLLSDSDVLKIADFGLSAHFIAAVSGDDASNDTRIAAGLSMDNDIDNEDVDDQDGPVGHLYEKAHFRRLKSVVGSPHYVAPEVLSSDYRYGYDGRKADMWSLGVILYGMLVGKLPFGKELRYCARHLKFSEWVRSVPIDPFTSRLSQNHQCYSHDSSHSNSSNGGSGSVFHSTSHHHHHIRLAGWQQSQTQQQTQRRLSNPNVPVPVTEFPSWFFPRSISVEARMLLSSLLHPDPAKRFSCEEASKHPWVLM